MQLECASDRLLDHLDAERDEIDLLFAEIDASVRDSKRIYRQAAGLHSIEEPENLEADEVGGDENVEPPCSGSPKRGRGEAERTESLGWVVGSDWDHAITKVRDWWSLLSEYLIIRSSEPSRKVYLGKVGTPRLTVDFIRALRTVSRVSGVLLSTMLLHWGKGRRFASDNFRSATLW
jgi:hypothetical protein